MSIQPIFLRAMLMAVVAEISAGQREALCSADDAARIAAEDRLVGDVMIAVAAVDKNSEEVGASLEFHKYEQHL